MEYYDDNIKSQGYKTTEDLKSWEKSYWYLRFFIDTNRFGSLAKDTKRITNIYNNLFNAYKLIQNEDHSTLDKIQILDKIFFETLIEGIKGDSRKNNTTFELYYHMQRFLIEPKDYFILAITLKEFLQPTNEALAKVPTTESTDFARKYGKAVLDTKKEAGLSTLIRDWDNFTEALSLNRERDLVVDLISSVRESLNELLESHFESITVKDTDIIISAICQEYERRVGQKRKQRAGNDLESVTDFILKYFNFKTSGRPEHFTTGLEVDNWIKDKDGWYIGISLKRTLRAMETNLYNRDWII